MPLYDTMNSTNAIPAITTANNIFSGTTYTAGAGSAGVSTYTGYTGTYTNAQWAKPSITTTSSALTVNDNNGKELVKLDYNGNVIWADSVNIDGAAEAFAKSITVGAEMAANITYAMKQRVRDAVFDELETMIQEKGVITTLDLTYLREAAKIIDRLKDVK